MDGWDGLDTYIGHALPNIRAGVWVICSLISNTWALYQEETNSYTRKNMALYVVHCSCYYTYPGDEGISGGQHWDIVFAHAELVLNHHDLEWKDHWI